MHDVLELTCVAAEALGSLLKCPNPSVAFDFNEERLVHWRDEVGQPAPTPDEVQGHTTLTVPHSLSYNPLV